MYYHHTSLASLSQDDLYTILWIGGVATGVSIPLFVMAITMKFIGKLDEYRGESIAVVVIGTLGCIFITITLVLLFINFVYMAFMFGTQGSLGMGVGEAIEWFLHTDWLAETDMLLGTISATGEAREVAVNTVMSIYVVKYLWLLALFGFAILVMFSTISKIHRMASNNPRINSFEFSITIMGASFVAIAILFGTFGLMNGTIESIFILSDNIRNTAISSYPPKLQMIYLDALNPSLLTTTVNTAGEEL